MDFKLDLKLQNEVDLLISKNEQAVVFATHQTDSMFILAFDLKKGGYGRKDIKIEINEDGSRMTISGEKPNMRGFQKTFIIPEGVALDKVKARFDQHESRLTIRMPKLVKGVVTRNGILEFKQPIPVPGNGITSADKQTENHDVHEEIKQQDPKPKSQVEEAEKSSSSTPIDEKTKQEGPKPESHVQEAEKRSSSNTIDGKTKQEDLKPKSHVEEAEKRSSSSSSTTIIAGSTLLVSLIVVFFGFIRSKNGSTKKTN